MKKGLEDSVWRLQGHFRCYHAPSMKWLFHQSCMGYV